MNSYPNLIVNQHLISNLNQLASIPLPISKLIIDQILTNRLNLAQIALILRNEQVPPSRWN